ncbi:MAG TPA: glycosyltransferase family 4 protein [Candidatus Magasanikbacteria bacterium]|nr:glycosyltransferase family 4 protein [Candidatus Magasanikbacteria bacterium]
MEKNNFKKMKILVATGIYPPDIGGPATYSKLLNDELPKRGFEVKILSFGEVRNKPKIIRHFCYFLKIIKRGRDVDVIYAQDPVSVGLPVLIATFFLRKKFLIRVAGDYAWEQSAQRFGVKDDIDLFQNKKYSFSVELLRSIQKLVVNGADLVITPSVYFKNLVSCWCNNPQKVITIYNGIKLVSLAKEDSKENLIITAGRLVPWKGFDFLIDLMVDLPNWQLIIVGDGPDYDRLSLLIKEKKLLDRVVLKGSLPREQLLILLSKAKLFILNTTFESFSFQVVEAMFAEVPVITTKVGNLAEIVEPNEEGILVEPNNKKEFLQAIKKITEDENFRIKIITQAKKKAEKFSIENTVNNLVEVLQKL